MNARKVAKSTFLVTEMSPGASQGRYACEVLWDRVTKI